MTNNTHAKTAIPSALEVLRHDGGSCKLDHNCHIINGGGFLQVGTDFRIGGVGFIVKDVTIQARNVLINNGFELGPVKNAGCEVYTMDIISNKI